MNEITLKNYRCFRERQSAKLAPLTLLVGENSTGKTSFLALIRALTDLAFGFRMPDFKEEPYDLGSFDEIAHVRSGRGDRAKSFEAGLGSLPRPIHEPEDEESWSTPSNLHYIFGSNGTTPSLISRRLSRGPIWINESIAVAEHYCLEVGTIRGKWKVRILDDSIFPNFPSGDFVVPRSIFLLADGFGGPQAAKYDFEPLEDAPAFDKEDHIHLSALSHPYAMMSRERPFASAPVRSKPRRTYDPSRTTPDPEGDYVPMYLAEVFSGNRREWKNLKEKLERFGNTSGLFDEISIKRLGKRASEPFQVQFRKLGGRRKGLSTTSST